MIPAVKQLITNLVGVYWDDHALGIFYSYSPFKGAYQIIGYTYRGKITINKFTVGENAKHLNYLESDKKKRVEYNQVINDLLNITKDIGLMGVA